MGVNKSHSISSSQYSNQQLQLRWSARLKHSDIVIDGSTVTRTSDGLNSFNLFGVGCLANCIIYNNSYDVKKWQVEINAIQRGLYVGICQIRQAQSHKFEEWDWTNINHGHYCIGSNKVVYSHSDPKKNLKLKSFKFQAGSILQFSYSPTRRKLKVVNNDNGNHFEMNIQKSLNEKYAICAYMYDKGDSIRLINS